VPDENNDEIMTSPMNGSDLNNDINVVILSDSAIIIASVLLIRFSEDRLSAFRMDLKSLNVENRCSAHTIDEQFAEFRYLHFVPTTLL